MSNPASQSAFRGSLNWHPAGAGSVESEALDVGPVLKVVFTIEDERAWGEGYTLSAFADFSEHHQASADRLKALGFRRVSRSLKTGLDRMARHYDAQSDTLKEAMSAANHALGELQAELGSKPGVPARKNPSGLDRKHERPYYGTKRPKPAMTSRAALQEYALETAEPPKRASSGLPRVFPPKLAVVVGPKGSYSSPDLTAAGERAFYEMTGEKYDFAVTPRHHPALIWLAENRPGSFRAMNIRVIPIPGGVYEIREYDGMEWVVTPETIQWVRIPAVKSNPKGIRIGYTGDWHDLAKAFGVNCPADEDEPGYAEGMRALQEKLIRNKSTIYPQITDWVKQLSGEATKIGDFDTMSLTKNLLLQLRTNGPRGVESVARNLPKLWV